jgi:Anti-sigma-28 factor, FlgM
MPEPPDKDYTGTHETMIDPDRTLKLDALKARIARSEYAVDPDAVAEALILRLALSRRRVRSRAPRAPRRPH